MARILVSMSAASNGIAQDELVRLRNGLRIMALQRLGDPEAAEEAAQESLARVLQALHEGRLEHPAKLGAFARSIAHHVVVDMIRTRFRHQAFGSEEEQRTAIAPDPLSALVSGEEEGRVRLALARLTARDRNLLRLTFFEGLAPTDLALRLREPAERIRKRKQRALERLRAAFLGVRSHAGPISPTEPERAATLPARGEGMK
jgi:RNA polymerase sigma factor (sigma-70 family)